LTINLIELVPVMMQQMVLAEQLAAGNANRKATY